MRSEDQCSAQSSTQSFFSSSLLCPAGLHWQSHRNGVFQYRPGNLVQETETGRDSSEAETEVRGEGWEVVVGLTVLVQEGVCEGGGGPQV